MFKNALTPTFFDIYNLSFSHTPNIRKIRVKVGPKINYISTLWAAAPTEL